tara:strand:- start:775 stop:1206 length:432 start_codon:yes stop_codon:yes gene_type:complete
MCQKASLGITLISLFTTGLSLFYAQGTQFKGKLSRLPVDIATAANITGTGNVTAKLIGQDLRITANFEGMSSPVTAIHIHRAARARRGPVAFILNLPMVNKSLFEIVKLNAEEVDVLNKGNYYLQIHTEQNPTGELRGWLLPY